MAYEKVSLSFILEKSKEVPFHFVIGETYIAHKLNLDDPLVIECFPYVYVQPK